MADKIQMTLEAMLPDLDSLVSIGIFTKAQVKNIIKKRRNHEYSLAKKVVTKDDFFKAIRYEKLLMKRKDRAKKDLKIKKVNFNDSHCK